jgi:glycosyltransferase involved in cell wall biosynthesis
MRKLIIQIPCYNEEGTLGETLLALPREVPGFDVVEWLVIDDGSRDRTSAVAAEYGVNHIVRFPRNRGLAAAFSAGLDEAVRQGADVIVNTDADNQYCADDIPKLVTPIVRGAAEIVIGERPIWQIDDFSWLKKSLQRFGSWIVRVASRTSIADAPSGFRAFSREAAMRLNVFNEYTYTLETIIQAGQKGLAITSVPIRTNPKTRPSRLIKSLPTYLARSAMTILRSFVTYRPFRAFAIPGTISILVGLSIAIRFLAYYLQGNGEGHIQSLILSALMLGTGFFLIVTAFVVDLVSVNRSLLELLTYRLKVQAGGPATDRDMIQTKEESRSQIETHSLFGSRHANDH